MTASWSAAYGASLAGIMSGVTRALLREWMGKDGNGLLRVIIDIYRSSYRSFPNWEINSGNFHETTSSDGFRLLFCSIRTCQPSLQQQLPN